MILYKKGALRWLLTSSNTIICKILIKNIPIYEVKPLFTYKQNFILNFQFYNILKR